jgi:type IV pilus assembly protein PilO
MRRNFQRQKIFLLAALGVFLAADSAMLIYVCGWSTSAFFPHEELAAQLTRARLLRADVARARAIQTEMPATKADCERFEQSLPPARGFYTTINSDLVDLGRKAGLEIGSLGFHNTDLSAHGVTEIAIEAKVTGNYQSVVRFINAMQKSKSYYILDSLSLVKDGAGPVGAPGAVSVDLHLKSYFRGAA